MFLEDPRVDGAALEVLHGGQPMLAALLVASVNALSPLVKNQRTPVESSPLVLHQRTAGTSLRSEPIGGNDTAWYRYRRPGDDLHPHLDGSWSHNLADDLVRLGVDHSSEPGGGGEEELGFRTFAL